MAEPPQIILAGAGIDISLIGWPRLDNRRRMDHVENEMREIRGKFPDLRERVAKIETLTDIIRIGMRLPRPAEGMTAQRK